MRKIQVSPPSNMTEDDEHLFLPFLSLELGPLKINRFKRTFVTYTGYCVHTKGLAKDSHHNYPRQFERFFREVNQSYEEANAGNLIELDDDNTYLLVHHPWFMYYHWICESIFRIWRVKDKTDQMILLLPETYKESEFVMSSLAPFTFKDIFFIPKDQNLLIRNLCMPQIKPIMEVYDVKMMKEIRSFYHNYVLNEQQINTNFGERIYLSRKKAERRKIDNEEDVISVLIKYNFTILYNEDYSFYEQVAIYSNAKYLVSIHGSGLTNMMFMPDNSTIFELHKKRTNNIDWHSLIFWSMASILGHKYFHQICDPTNIEEDIFNADLLVDIDLLERNMSLMFPSET